MNALTDPTLPGLAVALDASSFTEHLRRALPECRDGLEILGAHIMDVRYHHSGPCWLLYRLKLRCAGGRSSHQLLSAQLLRTGVQPSPVPESLIARYHDAPGSLLRTPVAYLPEAHAEVYAFPLDAALPWLFEASNPRAMRQHLGRLWAERDVKVREVTIRPLGYTPRARAAFTYDVLCESRELEVPELRRLIGKMHAKKPAHRLFAGSWALWRAAGKKLSLAPPVGYLPAAGLTLQEEVRGTRLGGLASEAGFVSWVRQTARMVAVLHRLSVPLTTKRRPHDEAQVVHKWAGVLAAIRPDLSRRVTELRDRLSSELLARATVAGPVHGDFHHTNVLVHEDGVTIIDLDEMAFGDPMLDVGRFLASLRIPALRTFGDLAGLAPASEAFLAEYLRQGAGDERRARLFEAASLVTAAASSFRIQRPAWKDEIQLLLDEADRVLAMASPRSLPSAPRREPAPAGPMEDTTGWARDPMYLQAALDPHVRKVYGAEIRGCRVVAGMEAAGPARLRYNLRGRLRGEKWRATLQGFPWTRHGGKAFVERLEALHAALQATPGGPKVPLPVAYLRPISLLVWESPSGRKLSSFLGGAEALQAAERVAQALDAIHGTRLSFDKRRPLAEDLSSLRRRLKKLEAIRPSFVALAAPLLAGVERRAQALLETFVPVLRTVHPHHVLLGDSVAFAKVEDVALGDACLDTADLLARLTLLGIQRGKPGGVVATAARLRELGAAGKRPEDQAVFEAEALLRLACTQAKLEATGEIAECLLGEARVRLGVDGGTHGE